jgi:hypothetical protein
VQMWAQFLVFRLSLPNAGCTQGSYWTSSNQQADSELLWNRNVPYCLA